MGRLYFEFPTREQRWKGVQCKSYWVKATQLTLLDSEICNSWKKIYGMTIPKYGIINVLR